MRRSRTNEIMRALGDQRSRTDEVFDEYVNGTLEEQSTTSTLTGAAGTILTSQSRRPSLSGFQEPMPRRQSSSKRRNSDNQLAVLPGKAVLDEAAPTTSGRRMTFDGSFPTGESARISRRSLGSLPDMTNTKGSRETVAAANSYTAGRSMQEVEAEIKSRRKFMAEHLHTEAIARRTADEHAAPGPPLLEHALTQQPSVIINSNNIANFRKETQTCKTKARSAWQRQRESLNIERMEAQAKRDKENKPKQTKKPKEKKLTAREQNTLYQEKQRKFLAEAEAAVTKPDDLIFLENEEAQRELEQFEKYEADRLRLIYRGLCQDAVRKAKTDFKFGATAEKRDQRLREYGGTFDREEMFRRREGLLTTAVFEKKPSAVEKMLATAKSKLNEFASEIATQTVQTMNTTVQTMNTTISKKKPSWLTHDPEQSKTKLEIPDSE